MMTVVRNSFHEKPQRGIQKLKVKTVSLNAYTFRKKQYFRAACIRAKLARKQANS